LKKAVVLLSGGMDSAVALYIARKKYDCFCLTFDYGQRHKSELDAAAKIARLAGAKHRVLKISFPWKGSSLLDKKIKVPIGRSVDIIKKQVPSTYVPARNIIFLSFATSCAEVIKAETIFIGAHTQDYSGYPDCRPDFFKVFQKVIDKGTKTGTDKKSIKIEIPLLKYNKEKILKIGQKLKVPFEFTWSCYKGGKNPCGSCDSCLFRKKAFEKLGIKDPASFKK